MKRLLLPLALILLAVPLFATAYRINGYSFEITGRTRESALRRIVGQDEGTVFKSEEALGSAIEEKRQMLLALRLFKDVQASWSAVASEGDIIDVNVHFSVIGAIVLTVTPGFSYDTNTGYNLQAVFVDSNFFGSTKETSVFVNLYDKSMELEDYYVTFHASTGFYIGNWDNSMNMSSYYLKSDPSQSYLKFRFRTSRTNMKKGAFGNELQLKVFPMAKDRTGIRRLQMLSDQISFSFGNDIGWFISYIAEISDDEASRVDNFASLGNRYDLNGMLPFKMYVGFKFDVTMPSGESPDFETELNMGSSDSDIKWKGDFRYGWSYGVQAKARDEGRLYLGGHAECYRLLGDRATFTARSIFKVSNYVDPAENGKYGQYIRGVKDDNPYLADLDFLRAGVLNATFTYQVLHFKLINFYVGAFVDIGHISPYGILAGAGVEFMTILADWPGAPFRISLGHSLTRSEEYEISLSSNFHY